MPKYSLQPIDIWVIVAYFFVIICFSILYSGKNENAEDYFLAGRKMTWPYVGLSLFASQISSTTIIGLSGDAKSMGISVYNYEWISAITMVFFVIFILPLYLNSQVYTMPEYLERRYNSHSRTYFAILTLFLNIVVDTAGSLYAGALILKLVFPSIPMWQTISVLAVLAGAYTVIGGLSAVMITDTFQAILLLVGSLVISISAYNEVGGWESGWEKINASVPSDMLKLVRSPNDPGMSWLGIIFGVPILSFYFWCTNQFMVQRVLGAKNVTHGRRGALLAGLLKLPLLFLMVLPGIVAIVLYPDLEKPDLVFPTLMFKLLPVGILGLVMAGFLAALMSQIDSTLNSASTLVTMDFVRRWYPEYSSKKLMWIGRFVTFIFMLLAVLWAPQIENYGLSLFKYLQNILAYTVPPVVVLFLFGSFWSRANSQGANATIAVGLVSSTILFVGIECMQLVKLHFLLVAPIIFSFCAIAMWVTSRLTPAPPAEAVAQYLWTPETYKRESKGLADVALYANYRFQSLILVFLSIVMLVSFW